MHRFPKNAIIIIIMNPIHAQVPKGVQQFKVNAFESASICLVVRGTGVAENDTLRSPLNLRRGSVVFVSAGQEVRLSVNSEDGMTVFRAYAGLS